MSTHLKEVHDSFLNGQTSGRVLTSLVKADETGTKLILQVEQVADVLKAQIQLVR